MSVLELINGSRYQLSEFITEMNANDKQAKYFWATVRSLSEKIGYSRRGSIIIPSPEKIELPKLKKIGNKVILQWLKMMRNLSRYLLPNILPYNHMDR